MRKILKSWRGLDASEEMPLNAFVMELMGLTEPTATIKFIAYEGDGYPEYEVVVSRPENEIEKSLRQGVRRTDHRFKL